MWKITAFAILGLFVLGLIGVTVARGDLRAAPAMVDAQLHPRVQAGFAATLPDAEVKALLEKYNVRPEAAFTWSSGVGGTHRVYKPLSADAFLQQARSDSIRVGGESLEGYPMRARRFVDQHSEDEVAGSDALTTEARSFLNLRAQVTGALRAARAGAPRIYGVEVVGDQADLGRLRADPAVKFSIDCSRNAEVKEPGRRGLEPAQYGPYWWDPAVEAMEIREVYRALQGAATGTDQQAGGA